MVNGGSPMVCSSSHALGRWVVLVAVVAVGCDRGAEPSRPLAPVKDAAPTASPVPNEAARLAALGKKPLVAPVPAEAAPLPSARREQAPAATQLAELVGKL